MTVGLKRSSINQILGIFEQFENTGVMALKVFKNKNRSVDIESSLKIS